MRASRSDRVLAAVVFTDMVDSTSVVEELGDSRAKALVNRHHQIVRRELRRFGGREMDTAGDGFFATFNEPAPAIAFACAAAQAVRELGIEIRAGVHFGECEKIGKKLGGITVVVGARVMALGAGGDVLVSGTVAELARGAGFGMSDRGIHALKGVDGDWRVLSVDSVDGAPRDPALDPAEAAARRASIESETGRRRWALPVVVSVLAALALVVGVILFVSTGETKASRPGPDSLARIDTTGTSFDTVVDAGRGAFPEAMAAGDGKLWVVNVASRTMMQIDPTSGETKVIGTTSVPTGVAFADKRVWVTYGFSSDPGRRVDVLEPSDPVLAAAQLNVPEGSYPIAASGDGSLWIADPLGSSLIRHDPVTGRSASVRLPSGSGPVALAVSQDMRVVWVASGRLGAVFKVNTANLHAPVERFGTGGAVPTALATAPDGSVWVAAHDADTVLALSPTGATRVEAAVGDRCDGPTGIVAVKDAIWVSCSISSNVIRLDPRDGSFVSTLAVTGDPGPMTVDGTGAVWVAVRGS